MAGNDYGIECFDKGARPEKPRVIGLFQALGRDLLRAGQKESQQLKDGPLAVSELKWEQEAVKRVRASMSASELAKLDADREELTLKQLSFRLQLGSQQLAMANASCRVVRPESVAKFEQAVADEMNNSLNEALRGGRR